MRKSKFWILGTITSIGFISLALSLTLDKKQTFVMPSVSSDEVQIKISGAIEKPGEYNVKKGMRLYEAIKLAKPLNNSDLSKLNFDSIINKNLTINIPFQKSSNLNWENFNSTSQLIDKGISKSIASKLLKHRELNRKTTWEEIKNIKSIGLKTLEKLKRILIL